ncbi:hypothetical protein HU200_009109 [Digitaria exilis]|uniref:Polysaccharide biosynthesis domain-containing protein n=1 Tax=Digitaria exilis TaxID=1010633 RepID=A0A835FMN9_9POAL|nr:hypothetical protein HU200_009109 [Digitaria exilis]
MAKYDTKPQPPKAYALWFDPHPTRTNNLASSSYRAHPADQLPAGTESPTTFLPPLLSPSSSLPPARSIDSSLLLVAKSSSNPFCSRGDQIDATLIRAEGGRGHSATMMKSMGSRDKLHRRAVFVVFAFCFAFATFLTFLYTTSHFTSAAAASSGSSSAAAAATTSTLAAESGGSNKLPLPVFDALVHYASISNATHRMSDTDIRAIAAVVRARAPCNLLVFGLGPESPLWLALNHGGRTVFLEENEFYVKYLEPLHPGLEAYDVSYTTKVRDFRDLLAAARAARGKECRPVQNLLFSECRLAINDLPNDLYDVPWDMVLIDGPSGWNPNSPGRMPSIFTTAVLARSGATAAKGHPTDVLVHDFQFELEQVLSKEFLCDENRVAGSGTPSVGHFVIPAGGGRSDAFCSDQESSSESGGNNRRRK